GIRDRNVTGVQTCALPILTIMGLLLGEFIGDAIIIEVVFSWPGIGRLLIDSILNRDYAVVQATVVIIATFYVFLNLMVDILYGIIDPRIQLEECLYHKNQFIFLTKK